MISFKRTDHFLITYPEGAKAEAIAFYKDTLALSQIEGNHPFGAIWFNVGDIEMHLLAENNNNFSLRHIAFEVKDLAISEAFLKSKAIEITYSSVIEGRSRCFFRDPFGNRFELIEYHH